MEKSMTPKYALVSGTYWAANVFLVGYANVAMGARGLDSFQIGIAFSGGAVVTIVMQMVSAFLMDGYREASAKRTIAVISMGTMLLAGILYLLPMPPAAVVLVYMLVIGMEFSMDSVIYTMAMEMMNYGMDINFGFCRGIGSISYALIMGGSGYLAAGIGIENLLLVFCLLQCLLVIVTLQMTNPRDSQLYQAAKIVQQQFERKGYIRFLLENKKILFMLLGFIFISMSGVVIENFQINILRELGGDEVTMGISRGLSAAVEFPLMCTFVYLQRRMKMSRILTVALGLYIIRSAIYAGCGSIGGVYAAQAVQGVAFALYNLSSTCYVNDSIRAADVAKGQAVIGMAIRGVGGILGNTCGGYLIANANSHQALQVCLAWTVCGALILVVTMVISGRGKKHVESGLSYS